MGCSSTSETDTTPAGVSGEVPGESEKHDHVRDAVGHVAAESVEVYPPGVPLILEGFRVSADAVDYLVAARDEGGSIVARDTSLDTLRVL